MNKLKLPILPLFLFCIGLVTAEEGGRLEESEITYAMYIEAVGKADGAELRVNDIPVGVVSGDEVLFSRNIEGFLVAEKNTLSIHPQSRESSIQARLVAYGLDEFVDGQGGKTFLFGESSQGKLVMVEGNLPSGRFSPKQWQTNDILTETDKTEAIEFVELFYTDLIQGNPKAIVGYLDPIYTDKSNFPPYNEKDVYVQGFVDRVNRLKKKEIWQYRPFSSDHVVLVPAGNGKLFDVRREDGSPFFRTDQESRDDRYTLYSMIGKKNGEWKIYR